MQLHTLLFIASTAVVAAWLYWTIRLLTGHEKLDAVYIAKLVVVAAIIVILMPLSANLLHMFGLEPIAAMLVLVAAIYIVHYAIVLEVEGDEWRVSIWVAFLTLLLTYAMQILLLRLAGIRLIAP